MASKKAVFPQVTVRELGRPRRSASAKVATPTPKGCRRRCPARARDSQPVHPITGPHNTPSNHIFNCRCNNSRRKCNNRMLLNGYLAQATTGALADRHRLFHSSVGSSDITDRETHLRRARQARPTNPRRPISQNLRHRCRSRSSEQSAVPFGDGPPNPRSLELVCPTVQLNTKGGLDGTTRMDMSLSKDLIRWLI